MIVHYVTKTNLVFDVAEKAFHVTVTAGMVTG